MQIEHRSEISCDKLRDTKGFHFIKLSVKCACVSRLSRPFFFCWKEKKIESKWIKRIEMKRFIIIYPPNKLTFGWRKILEENFGLQNISQRRALGFKIN